MPSLLELTRLVGAPARDQGERGPVRAHGGELLGSQLGRHEAEDADAPRALAQQSGGARQQRVGLAAAHQGESQERQALPPRATASANSARSLTRVIGPCTSG